MVVAGRRAGKGYALKGDVLDFAVRIVVLDGEADVAGGDCGGGVWGKEWAWSRKLDHELSCEMGQFTNQEVR